ncbi:MAG: hypothetical protein JWO59_1881 [Chloroflexi bacterium]|nr:hypothetical protein [Chloroflexota bacterium]
MTSSKSWRFWAILCLAILTCTTSAFCLEALNASGEARIGSVAFIKIAAGYDRTAERTLQGTSALGPDTRVQAVELSKAAIRLYPYDTSAWLRLAYVDSLTHARLSPEGATYLKRSYDLVAIDPFVGLWRVRFALENAQALNTELRSAVRNEAAALWRNSETQRPLREMATTIRNPAGRLSVGLWLNRLDASVAK